MNIVQWVDGQNNHKHHTLSIDNQNKLNEYSLVVNDYEIPKDRNILEMFHDLFSSRQTATVEVLYSGGIDSELILKSCILNKIPVIAVTMRLLIDGIPLNTHDLYYSEKFCRNNNIQQKIIDLEVKPFFESGRFLDYLNSYLITEPHVATHFWLLEQCTGYPVVGGDYYWPHAYKPVISPMRLEFSCYDKFMQDKGIYGLGNALNHSLELCSALIKKHVQCYDVNLPSDRIKAKTYDSLDLGYFEPRRRSYGWETMKLNWFDKNIYKGQLISKHGMTKNKITWGTIIAKSINGNPDTNDAF